MKEAHPDYSVERVGMESRGRPGRKLLTWSSQAAESLNGALGSRGCRGQEIGEMLERQMW